MVKQNRGMLERIIEAVLHLAKQELPFRGHGESIYNLSKGNDRELLECFPKFDSIFERRLHGRLAQCEGGCKSGGVFAGVSSDIQN